MTRYEIDTSETQYQPESNNTVMVNMLDIVDLTEMDDVEAILLTKLYEKIFTTNTPEPDNFSFENISTWHRQWLGNVYGPEKSET